MRSYKSGELIDITVELTTPHRGWFEFRLCKNDNVNKYGAQFCFTLFNISNFLFISYDILDIVDTLLDFSLELQVTYL